MISKLSCYSSSSGQAALALRLMALQVPLDDLLPAEAAFWARLGGCRARLALVCLQTDPQLELLAAAVAEKKFAAAALQLLLTAAWGRHCRARGQGQIPVLVVAIVPADCQQLHGQAQCVQLASRPELARFGRHLLLDEGLVLQRAGGEGDQIQIVPAELAAALRLWVHLLPEAVADPAPGAARSVPHFHVRGAKDFEDVQHHGAGGRRDGACAAALLSGCGMAVEALKLIDNTACIRSGLRSPFTGSRRVKGRTRLRFRSLIRGHGAFIC